VILLARAFEYVDRTGSAELLDSCSDVWLRRLWQATRFSSGMATIRTHNRTKVHSNTRCSLRV
jgi:p-hydroxybenzoate 3-monooxygenase